MKILCLHGKGTSGAIFQSQTAALRAKLDASFVFDFVDGPFRAASAPGIDQVFGAAGAGTYSWWPEETPAALRAAHGWLDAYLAAHGPYDALMGFSQGCLLIASYLMHGAAGHQGQKGPPPPVRGAIFVCGGLSFVSLADLGVGLSPAARDLEQRSIAALHARTRQFRAWAAAPEQIPRGVGLWDDPAGLVHDPAAPLPADERDVFGMDFSSSSSSAAAFPPELYITLPTVHVFGRRDPRLPAAVQLAHACRVRTLYDHGGGHEIPRTTAVSERVAGLIAQLAKDMEA